MTHELAKSDIVSVTQLAFAVRAKMARVAFLHLDLGIGGAERLVVDAGIALQNAGHTVHFFTSHHDQNHCFDETRPPAGRLPVTCMFDWLPRRTLGLFTVFWSIVRMQLLALYLVLARRRVGRVVRPVPCTR
jgi:hypothetical protein